MEPDEVDITLDLGPARDAAERTRERLIALRRRFDLSAFEHTRSVRIAPLVTPHSHPVLTLSCWDHDDVSLLMAYLHEQMHWRLTSWSEAHPDDWRRLLGALAACYPGAPAAVPEGASDLASTHLHLIINWLEIDATSQFFSRDSVEATARARPFYRWIYSRVLADWTALRELFVVHGVVARGE